MILITTVDSIYLFISREFPTQETLIKSWLSWYYNMIYVLKASVARSGKLVGNVNSQHFIIIKPIVLGRYIYIYNILLANETAPLVVRIMEMRVFLTISYLAIGTNISFFFLHIISVHCARYHVMETRWRVGSSLALFVFSTLLRCVSSGTIST